MKRVGKKWDASKKLWEEEDQNLKTQGNKECNILNENDNVRPLYAMVFCGTTTILFWRVAHLGGGVRVICLTTAP